MLVSLKLGADFRGGVQTQQCNRQSQRPTPSLLDSRIDSERRALTTLLVRVYARLWKRTCEKPLQGTLVYQPAAGHYNSGKCFIVIFGYSPSMEGVGSQGSAWHIPPSKLFYSEAMALR
jgi:hypothetical protein